MRTTCLAGLASFALTGCVTTLDTTRPVEIKKGWASSIKQDGRPVGDLADRLKEHPASAPRMEGFDAKAYGAAALQAAGAGLILYNSWSNLRNTTDRMVDPLHKDTTSWGLTLVGAVLYLGSLPLAISANAQLAEAAEAYNASFSPGARPAGAALALPLPFLATVEGAGGRRQCVAGVAGRF